MIRRPKNQTNPAVMPARLTVFVLAVLVWVWAVGCEPYQPVTQTYRPRPTRPVPARNMVVPKRIVLPTVASINREPVVRVRIAKGQSRVSVSSYGGLNVGPADPRMSAARAYNSAVAVTYQQGAFLITDAQRNTIRWALSSLMLSPRRAGAAVTYDGKTYPGVIVLVPQVTPRGVATGGLDVVNHVGMESYLPGVVERELYGSWEPATFRAATIAARTYAVFESSMNRDKHYDLESSTASQAYGGHAKNPKATAAVAQTRGMLLEYRGRIVPAFYSSACGGVGQDAVAAFTWLPGLPDIDPLRGRDHGACCQKSTKFRWPSVVRNKSTLERRIKAWGAKEDHPIKALRGIRDIRIAKVNSVGRPTAFAIYDNAGLMYTLGPEQFRFACNSDAPGIGAVAKEHVLYSSHVQVAASGPSTVTFYNGRGYGHGVGLCQFGAQGLVQAGQNEYAVLAFYYPGSRVVRAYQ